MSSSRNEKHSNTSISCSKTDSKDKSRRNLPTRKKYEVPQWEANRELSRQGPQQGLHRNEQDDTVQDKCLYELSSNLVRGKQHYENQLLQHQRRGELRQFHKDYQSDKKVKSERREETPESSELHSQLTRRSGGHQANMPRSVTTNINRTRTINSDDKRHDGTFDSNSRVSSYHFGRRRRKKHSERTIHNLAEAAEGSTLMGDASEYHLEPQQPQQPKQQKLQRRFRQPMKERKPNPQKEKNVNSSTHDDNHKGRKVDIFHHDISFTEGTAGSHKTPHQHACPLIEDSRSQPCSDSESKKMSLVSAAVLGQQRATAHYDSLITTQVSLQHLHQNHPMHQNHPRHQYHHQHCYDSAFYCECGEFGSHCGQPYTHHEGLASILHRFCNFMICIILLLIVSAGTYLIFYYVVAIPYRSVTLPLYLDYHHHHRHHQHKRVDNKFPEAIFDDAVAAIGMVDLRSINQQFYSYNDIIDNMESTNLNNNDNENGKYDRNYPSLSSSFATLKPNQSYYIDILLELPETKHNRIGGMFGVTTQLFASPAAIARAAASDDGPIAQQHEIQKKDIQQQQQSQTQGGYIQQRIQKQNQSDVVHERNNDSNDTLAQCLILDNDASHEKTNESSHDQCTTSDSCSSLLSWVRMPRPYENLAQQLQQCASSSLTKESVANNTSTTILKTSTTVSLIPSLVNTTSSTLPSSSTTSLPLAIVTATKEEDNTSTTSPSDLWKQQQQSASHQQSINHLLDISLSPSSSPSSSKVLLGTSRRSCRFPYRSSWILLLRKIIYLIPILFWEDTVRESQVVTVPAFRHYLEKKQHPLEQVIVTILNIQQQYHPFYFSNDADMGQFKKLSHVLHQQQQQKQHYHFSYDYYYPEIVRAEVIIGHEHTLLQHILRTWFFTCFVLGTFTFAFLFYCLYNIIVVRFCVLPHTNNIPFNQKQHRFSDQKYPGMTRQRSYHDDYDNRSTAWDNPSANLNLDEEDFGIDFDGDRWFDGLDFPTFNNNVNYNANDDEDDRMWEDIVSTQDLSTSPSTYSPYAPQQEQRQPFSEHQQVHRDDQTQQPQQNWYEIHSPIDRNIDIPSNDPMRNVPKESQSRRSVITDRVVQSLQRGGVMSLQVAARIAERASAAAAAAAATTADVLDDQQESSFIQRQSHWQYPSHQKQQSSTLQQQTRNTM